MMGEQPTTIKNDSAHVRGFTKRDLLRLIDNPFPRGYRLKSFAGGNFYPFPGSIARLLAAAMPSFAVCIFIQLEKILTYDGGYLSYTREQMLETNFFLGESPPI